jgi:hypothetical protein
MSTPVRRRRLVLDVCLGAALALASCKKHKDDPVVAPDGGGGTPTGPGAAVELAPVEHPSQLLPRDTALLLMGTSVNRAAEVLERDRLVKVFATQYTSLKSVISGSLGRDLLDPATWRDVGLDAGGAVGLAISDLVNPRFVLFATVSDRAKLVALVREVAGKSKVELVEEAYGSASLLRPKGENDGVIVLRDRFVALVMGSGPESLELAKRMVTMDPNVSLAAHVGYRKATGGLRAADVTLYFDVAGMVDQANAQQEAHTTETSGNWAQDELVRAQKEGAPPERLAELERQVKEVQANDERWRRQAEGERALAELVVSGIEGVGFTATVKRSGPVFDGRVVAGPDAFVRRLFVNREAAPALPVAMNGTPLWCGWGRVDATAGLELVAAMAAADGVVATEWKAEAKRGLGLDLEAELAPALAGDAELCLVIEGSLGEGRVDPKTQFGLGAIVRVSDAPKAKYLLAKVATSGSELGTRMKKRGEGYTVDVPDWRTVHVQPVGDRIVVSSDAELGKRLATGDPGSMPSKIRPPAARGAIDLAGTAASQAFDLSLGTLWTMVGRASMGGPWVVAPGMTAEQMDKLPLSAKSKQAKKAMKKAQEQVEALEAKREVAQVKDVLAITDALGIMVTAAIEDDRGFTLTGGQFLRAETLGQVLESLLEGVLRERSGSALDPADEKALGEAWQRYNDAEQAYTDARMKDAERFQAKQGKATPTPPPAP